MKVSRETMDMRVQRAIAADVKMREVAKKAKNWPDMNAKAGAKHDLKPLHVHNPATAHFGKEEQEKVA